MTGDNPDASDDSVRHDPPETHPPTRPGLSTFTIEGRAAPALFVVGWVATIVGLGLTIVTVVAGGATILLVVGLVLLSLGLVAGAGSQAIERRSRGLEPYQGPSPVLVFAATVPVSILAVSAVAALLSAVGIRPQAAGADLLGVAVQEAVTVGLVALLVVGTGALSWREMGLARRVPQALVDLAWGAVFVGPVIAATLVVTALLVTVFQVTPPSPLEPTGESSGLLLHLVAGAVLAPVAEEILFRGVATTAWVRRYGTRPGILRAAIFFAAAHVLLLGGSTVGEATAIAIVAFAGRLPVAIALGWVYARRRSLWAPIGLHAAFNAILLVLAYAGPVSGAGG